VTNLFALTAKRRLRHTATFQLAVLTVVNAFTAGNFAAQRAMVYPQGFRAFLDKLRIAPQKEGEVYDGAGADERKIRPTGGWLYFVGELIEKDERLIQTGDSSIGSSRLFLALLPLLASR
jgi:hypothetical protein